MDYANIAIIVVVLVAGYFIGRTGFRKVMDEDDRIMDHVSIKANDREQWQLSKRKLDEAAAKYGKPFRSGPTDMPHEFVHRQEPRSRDLLDIDAESKRQREGEKLTKMIEDETNVTKFGRASR
jgi:hypothetical protein